MKISRETLHQLIENKLCQAGLKREHAATVAEVLVYADARGIHSHGAVRVEYYAERISKGGTNREPEFRLEETGPCSAILHADNAAGQVAAKMGMEHAIKTAQQNGVAVVGISRMGHSGAISYFVQQAARAGFIGISMCQSDPMVVPFGGAEIYYGTNPLSRSQYLHSRFFAAESQRPPSRGRSPTARWALTFCLRETEIYGSGTMMWCNPLNIL